MAKESFVDKDRLGCVGASFGGFSVYWLAGHHNKRFKAFIAHDGIFNMEMQYLETEEMWFANWDMGGAYWENGKCDGTTHLPIPRTCLSINGIHRFSASTVKRIIEFWLTRVWRRLMQVVRGVPAELLIYPDENHC